MDGFQLYLTDSGYKLLENPIMIDISNAVENGCGSFSEIVEITKRPRSTVSSYTKKLLELGLIKEVVQPNKPDVNRFVLNGHCLARKISPTTYYSDSYVNLKAGILESDAFPKYLVRMLLSAISHSGCSVEPLIKELMEWIGAYGCRYHKTATFEEGILKLTEFFSRSNIADVEFIGKMPLKIRIVPKYSVTPKTIDLFLKTVGFLIASYISTIPDSVPLKIGSIELCGIEGGIVKMEIDRHQKTENHHGAPISDAHHADFEIYWINRMFTPVTNALEIKILNKLRKYGWQGLKTLSDEYSVPLTTIAYHIKNLEERGLILQEKSGETSLDHSLQNPILIFGGGDAQLKPHIAEERLDCFLKEIWNNPEHAVKHILDYEYYLAHLRNFNLDELFSIAMLDLADKLCDSMEDFDLTEILGAISRNSHNWFSYELGLVSTNPVCITLVSDFKQNESDAELMIAMFDKLICRILFNITKVKHVLSESHVFQDKNVISLTFKADIAY